MKSRVFVSLFVLSLLTGVSSAFGQRIGFTWNGETLKDGDVISVAVEAEDYGGGFYIVEGSTNTGANDLQIVNNGSMAAEITVVGKVERSTTPSPVVVQLCAGGNCTRDTQGTGRIEKKTTLAGGASVPARWEVDFDDVSNYGEVETTLSLTSGGTTVAIGVKFVYVATGIRPLTKERREDVYDMLGRRVSSVNPLAPGLYIVGGRKVWVKVP